MKRCGLRPATLVAGSSRSFRFQRRKKRPDVIKDGIDPLTISLRQRIAVSGKGKSMADFTAWKKGFALLAPKPAAVQKAVSVTAPEAAVAPREDPLRELRDAVLQCMLWEESFDEGRYSLAAWLADLVPKNRPTNVAALAVEAREKLQLRRVPLFLVHELARRKGAGPLVADALERIIRRADDITDFVTLYWKEKKQPLSAGTKRGLARAFRSLDAYRLARHNRESAVKLRDVLFLCHPKPRNVEQAAAWKKLADGMLPPPDTWELALARAQNKKEIWEELLRGGKVPGLAIVRHLNEILSAGVNERLISSRLDQGVRRTAPFLFLSRARLAPKLEDVLGRAMLKSVQGMKSVPGSTGLLVDVSRSISKRILAPSGLLAADASVGLAILLREKADLLRLASFSSKCVEVPLRRGFVLRDAIMRSQAHSGTDLRRALRQLRETKRWRGVDRLIVVTDERSHDGILPAWAKHAYVVNVAPYQHGVSYGSGWTHIDGWSERIFDYIVATEAEPVQ